MRKLILSVLLATLAYGVQAGEPEGEPQEAPESADTQEAPAPEAENPGDAFENFRPSEEISADNAVPFPVDI